MRFFFGPVLMAFLNVSSAFAEELKTPDSCEKNLKPAQRYADLGLSRDPLDRLLGSYKISLCARLRRGEISRKEFQMFLHEMTTAVNLEKQSLAVGKRTSEDEETKLKEAAAEAEQPLAAEKSQKRTVEFLPERILYRPYVADPRRPRFSIKWLRGDGGESHIDTAIGGYFPILDLKRPSAPDEKAQVAAFGGFWSRWDVKESLDQVGSDDKGGLSLNYKKGLWAVRLQYAHESDHLGDELVLRTGRTRIDYHREEIGLGFSFEPQPQYRLYAEGGYAFIRGDPNKPWRLQFGAEWEGKPWLPLGGRPFAAADLQTWEESKWNPNVNLQFGVVFWNVKRSHSLRLSLDLYRGRDPLGEFLRERLRYLALGFSLDF